MAKLGLLNYWHFG